MKTPFSHYTNILKMEIMTTEHSVNNNSNERSLSHTSLDNKGFITANTIESTLEEIKSKHVIPVFVKDNEPVISHADFIESTIEVVSEVFHGETILKPSVRLSHEIKGRIPEAKHKSAKELLEHERTIYYERMAFIIEIPTIQDVISKNQLSLTVGGVKAYNLDNLYSRKGSDESFKVFIGFKNTVCTNLCIWSDGYVGDLKVKSPEQLKACMRTLFSNYSASTQLQALRSLTEYCLTEQQFAQLIGKCRMYNYLPSVVKKDITPLLLGDTQIASVVKDYYKDSSFCRSEDGSIDLWRLYNLFTNSSKTSYIDTFVDRTVNASLFINELRIAHENRVNNWFLN
jgi:hypothetical protein